MRISHIHHRSGNLTCHPVDLDRPAHHPRHTHRRLDRPDLALMPQHPAAALAAVRAKPRLLQALARPQPGRGTARPIAAQLRLAAVGVKQPQEETPVGAPVQKLNPISANPRVTRAKPLRQHRMASLWNGLLDHEKIVAAGMGLHKRDGSRHVLGPLPSSRLKRRRALPPLTRRKRQNPHHPRCGYRAEASQAGSGFLNRHTAQERIWSDSKRVPSGSSEPKTATTV